MMLPSRSDPLALGRHHRPVADADGLAALMVRPQVDRFEPGMYVTDGDRVYEVVAVGSESWPIVWADSIITGVRFEFGPHEAPKRLRWVQDAPKVEGP